MFADCRWIPMLMDSDAKIANIAKMVKIAKIANIAKMANMANIAKIVQMQQIDKIAKGTPVSEFLVDTYQTEYQNMITELPSINDNVKRIAQNRDDVVFVLGKDQELIEATKARFFQIVADGQALVNASTFTQTAQ